MVNLDEVCLASFVAKKKEEKVEEVAASTKRRETMLLERPIVNATQRSRKSLQAVQKQKPQQNRKSNHSAVSRTQMGDAGNSSKSAAERVPEKAAGGGRARKSSAIRATATATATSESGNSVVDLGDAGVQTACNDWLARIVDCLKTRFLFDPMCEPLSLGHVFAKAARVTECFPREEIITWLMTKALPDHPNIECTYSGCDGGDGGGKVPLHGASAGAHQMLVTYLPPYNLRDRAAVAKLLAERYRRGKGGVSLFELDDSIPNAKAIVDAMPNFIDMPTVRKNHIYFYDDPTMRVLDQKDPNGGDVDFLQLWRSVPNASEEEVESYLKERQLPCIEEPLQLLSINGAQQQAMASKEQKQSTTARKRAANGQRQKNKDGESMNNGDVGDECKGGSRNARFQNVHVNVELLDFDIGG